MDQKIIDLFDAFTHGAMTRRAFLDRMARLAGSSAAAAALLPMLENDYALADVVAEDDPRLAAETAAWRGGTGYLARLNGGGQRPAVVVIHENRGLNPHIRDVALRLAVEGFLALAPDLLAAQGGTPEDADRAREMIGALDGADVAAGLTGAVAFLAGHAESTGKVGAVGFCWGGGWSNRLAAAGTELAASVAYYGVQLPADQVPQVAAPLMLHYAGLDARVNAGIADYTAALDAAGKPYEMHLYDGVNHAFNNDTNAARYDAAAAALAWERTLDFLRRQLGG